MNKAPDAFRTISEVADELDLPQHVLRFWESRFPHIKPMKRGGGRRYYRPDDVDLLRGIRHLLYGDGYTIRGVQRILREQGVRAVQSIGQGHTIALPERSSEDDGHDDGRDGGNDDADVLDFVPPRQFGATTPRDVEDASDEAAAPVPAPPKRPAAPAAAPASPTAPASPAAPASPSAPQAGPPAPAATPPVAAPQGLAPADLDRLKTALADLEECRRLLDRTNEAGP